MKNAIFEYLEPTVQDKNFLWRNAIFVFDTNILLNLYRFSKKTRDALISSMKNRKERIWIPYQVSYEFMEKRCDVILESVKRYEDLKNEADSFTKHCIQQLRKKSSDAEVEQLRNQLNGWLAKEQMNELLVSNPLEDIILSQLMELFEGKVGRKFTDEEIDNIKKEGENRYAEGLPPGYKDAKKKISVNDDNNMFGDLIIWKQIIEYSRTEKKDILFIINDRKEDWWNIIHGKTIGPRVELRKEFYEETSQKFHMYTMESFLQRCNDEDGEILAEGVLEEITNIGKERKRKAKKQQKREIDKNKQIEDLQRRIKNKQEFIDFINQQENEDMMTEKLRNQLSQLQYGKKTLEKRLHNLMVDR